MLFSSMTDELPEVTPLTVDELTVDDIVVVAKYTGKDSYENAVKDLPGILEYLRNQEVGSPRLKMIAKYIMHRIHVARIRTR